jgi:hypothetical protein
MQIRCVYNKLRTTLKWCWIYSSHGSDATNRGGRGAKFLLDFQVYKKVKLRVKITLEQALKAQKRNTGVALLFL